MPLCCAGRSYVETGRLLSAGRLLDSRSAPLRPCDGTKRPLVAALLQLFPFFFRYQTARSSGALSTPHSLEGRRRAPNWDLCFVVRFLWPYLCLCLGILSPEGCSFLRGRTRQPLGSGSAINWQKKSFAPVRLISRQKGWVRHPINSRFYVFTAAQRHRTIKMQQ